MLFIRRVITKVIALFFIMEIGINLIQGCVFGIRTFNSTQENPYNEIQIFVLCFCIYIIWD